LHWKLEVKDIVNSVGLRYAFLSSPTNLGDGTGYTTLFVTAIALKVNHKHIFQEIRKSTKDTSNTLHAVYWVHFIVKYATSICPNTKFFSEDWKLYNKHNELVFTSPELHANHHLWKFATTIPLVDDKTPLEWKVVDIDNQVSDLPKRRLVTELGADSGAKTSSSRYGRP
jgi:hypothetical protein